MEVTQYTYEALACIVHYNTMGDSFMGGGG